MNYQERKAARVEAFKKIAGRKMVMCLACSGSGYYDHNGSPRCGACDGRGKTLESDWQMKERTEKRSVV